MRATRGVLARVLAALSGGGGSVPRQRVAGRPASPTGASSFHLWWETRLPLVEVSAVFEVVTPPSVSALYYWALQASFADAGGVVGVGHTGLQWNRRYPGSTAVNWGGYAARDAGGGVLAGSGSPLPGFADDANTFAFPWVAGRPYRLRIHPAPPPEGGERGGVWRAEVTDLATGSVTVVRDLYGGGDRLTAPVVWSEVFADCDAPPVVVRWSGLEGVGLSGERVVVGSVRVTYQAVEDGGCSNTTVQVDDHGVVQVTNARRETPHGAVVPVPRRTTTA